MNCPSCGRRTWFDVVECRKCGWVYSDPRDRDGSANPGSESSRLRVSETRANVTGARWFIRLLLPSLGIGALGPGFGHAMALDGYIPLGFQLVGIIGVALTEGTGAGNLETVLVFTVIFFVYSTLAFALVAAVATLFRRRAKHRRVRP